MPVPIKERYFEDYGKGEVFESGDYLITREEVIDFAGRYDPQPFHLDEEAARQSIFGGLIASGWMTCGVLMRMLVDDFISPVSSMGSPGVDELRWLKPVRPGDRLRARVTVVDSRRSASRPDRGHHPVPPGGAQPERRSGAVHARHGHVQVPAKLKVQESTMPTYPNPYKIDLDRNPANYTPLTPISLLNWAADVYPDHLAVIHGPLRRNWAGGARALAPAGERACRPGHRRRRHRIGDPAEYAADDRGALRRADDRRGAEHHQHPARCRHRGVHAGALRRQGADHRQRILAGCEAGAGADAGGRQDPAVRGGCGRSGLRGSGRTPRRDRVRGLARRRGTRGIPRKCPRTNGMPSA